MQSRRLKVRRRIALSITCVLCNGSEAGLHRLLCCFELEALLVIEFLLDDEVCFSFVEVVQVVLPNFDASLSCCERRIALLNLLGRSLTTSLA